MPRKASKKPKKKPDFPENPQPYQLYKDRDGTIYVYDPDIRRWVERPPVPAPTGKTAEGSVTVSVAYDIPPVEAGL